MAGILAALYVAALWLGSLESIKGRVGILAAGLGEWRDKNTRQRHFIMVKGVRLKINQINYTMLCDVNTFAGLFKRIKCNSKFNK